MITKSIEELIITPKHHQQLLTTQLNTQTQSNGNDPLACFCGTTNNIKEQ